MTQFEVWLKDVRKYGHVPFNLRSKAHNLFSAGWSCQGAYNQLQIVAARMKRNEKLKDEGTVSVDGE